MPVELPTPAEVTARLSRMPDAADRLARATELGASADSHAAKFDQAVVTGRRHGGVKGLYHLAMGGLNTYGANRELGMTRSEAARVALGGVGRESAPVLSQEPAAASTEAPVVRRRLPVAA